MISMDYLNAKTAEKYVHHFCKGVELEGDFTPVYQLVSDSNIAPAFMAEIIENVKSNMVIRGDNKIEALHFMVCIKSYLRQVALAQTRDTSVTKEMKLADALRENILDTNFATIVGDIVYDKAQEVFNS